MSQIIEVPGHGQVEFPDGMSDDQISAAIKRNMMVPKDATVSEMSKRERILAGAGQGFNAIRNRLAQIETGIPNVLPGPLGMAYQSALSAAQNAGLRRTPEQIQSDIDAAKVTDAPLLADPYGLGGSIGANVAATMLPGASIQSAATNLASRVMPAMIAKTAGAAAAGAGVSAATAPVASDESFMEKAGKAGVASAAADLLLRGAGRVVQPIVQSDSVQALVKHNIIPTIGQAAGGVINNLEQKLSSVPIVGNILQSGRGRTIEEFNRAAINQGVPVGQKPITEIGNAGIDALEHATSRGYNALVGGKAVLPTPQLRQTLDAAKNAPRLPLNEESKAQFDRIIERVVWDRIAPGGKMAPVSADLMKREVIGELGQTANEIMKGTPTASERALATAIRKARDDLQQWMLPKIGVSPAQMAAADAAYTAKAAVTDAAESAGAVTQGGKFTPRQLLREARPNSATERLALAGQEVLPANVPNSGSVDRAMVAALLGAGGAGANEYFGGPGYLTALALSPALASRTAARYAIGETGLGIGPYIQQPIAGVLREAAPYAGVLGRAYEEKRRQ